MTSRCFEISESRGRTDRRMSPAAPRPRRASPPGPAAARPPGVRHPPAPRHAWHARRRVPDPLPSRGHRTRRADAVRLPRYAAGGAASRWQRRRRVHRHHDACSDMTGNQPRIDDVIAADGRREAGPAGSAAPARGFFTRYLARWQPGDPASELSSRSRHGGRGTRASTHVDAQATARRKNTWPAGPSRTRPARPRPGSACRGPRRGRSPQCQQPSAAPATVRTAARARDGQRASGISGSRPPGPGQRRRHRAERVEHPRSRRPPERAGTRAHGGGSLRVGRRHDRQQESHEHRAALPGCRRTHTSAGSPARGAGQRGRGRSVPRAPGPDDRASRADAPILEARTVKLARPAGQRGASAAPPGEREDTP